jgi:hypothetical protein
VELAVGPRRESSHRSLLRREPDLREPALPDAGFARQDDDAPLARSRLRGGFAQPTQQRRATDER